MYINIPIDSTDSKILEVERKSKLGSLKRLLFKKGNDVYAKLIKNKKGDWHLYYDTNIIPLNYIKLENGIKFNQKYLNNCLSGYGIKKDNKRYISLFFDRINDKDIGSGYNLTKINESMRKLELNLFTEENISFRKKSSKNIRLMDNEGKTQLYSLLKNDKHNFSVNYSDKIKMIDSILITCYIFLI